MTLLPKNEALFHNSTSFGILSYAPQGCIYLIKKYSETSNIVKYYYNLK